MNVDAPTIARHAAATGFRPETLEKVIRLGELLADIGRHPLLSRVFALKGGTALNLFFGAPRRLSVDLDFNYIGSTEREEMLRQRPEVERAVQIIATGNGYRIQRAADAHAGRKFYLNYPNAAGAPDRVEIDVNYLFRTPVGETAVHAMWQPEGMEEVRFPLIPTEELFAGKMLAMLDRVAPRDLFDVALLPEYGGEILRSIRLRKVFIALAGTLALPLTRYTQKRLERIDENIVNQQLLPMVRTDSLLTAEQLRSRAWTVMEPLLELMDEEREYIGRLHEGDLQTSLLFPDDPGMAQMLAKHPALRWKVDNIRRGREA